LDLLGVGPIEQHIDDRHEGGGGLDVQRDVQHMTETSTDFLQVVHHLLHEFPIQWESRIHEQKSAARSV